MIIEINLLYRLQSANNDPASVRSTHEEAAWMHVTQWLHLMFHSPRKQSSVHDRLIIVEYQGLLSLILAFSRCGFLNIFDLYRFRGKSHSSRYSTVLSVSSQVSKYAKHCRSCKSLLIPTVSKDALVVKVPHTLPHYLLHASHFHKMATRRRVE